MYFDKPQYQLLRGKKYHPKRNIDFIYHQNNDFGIKYVKRTFFRNIN